MPAATDIENLVADRLWALLEAQATITAAVLPGNRNKGTEAGWLRNAIANLPVERRRMSITFARFRNSLYTRRDAYSVESRTFTAAGPEFEVSRTNEAVITFTEPMPADPGANPLREAIEQTLFLAGPTLGLAEVPADGLGELTGETRLHRQDEFPFPGRVTTMRLSITTIQSAVAKIQETV